MKIRIAGIEDGLDNIGFRKISAAIRLVCPDTKVAYIPTGNWRGLLKYLTGKGIGELSEQGIYAVAQFLAEGDLVGLSSMTPFSSIVYKIIAQIRLLNPQAYIIWGGIHPIVYPEDAIKHADAICTGEGEFAFESFFDLFKKGGNYKTTSGFWFRTDQGIIRNTNLPLMQQQEMDVLPPLTYQDDELIYHAGEGLKPIDCNDFLKYAGLTYHTVWSIGCPMKCTYCSNSKFIENDKGYRKIRHSSPRTIIDEIKRAKSKHPHISSITFHDDSFLALPYRVLEEFSFLYKSEVGIPFTVAGVIPNYVREEKIELLLDAGMHRVRMGIQSGSQNILDFYQRPTPLPRIREATTILNKYKKYMLPPFYDIILENPLETSEDTRATLDLLYEMPRPFNLNIYALRIIPNTQLAKDLDERGIKIPPINEGFVSGYHPTMGNVLVFLIGVFRIPNWLYVSLRKKVYPVLENQEKYPISLSVFRVLALMKRAIEHIRFMDFSILPGKLGYYFWKMGIVAFCQRFLSKKYCLSEK